MKVESREYKVMLEHGRFGDRQAAVAGFWAEVTELAGSVEGVQVAGDLDKKVKRTIVFLDTPDLTLRRQGLVLRMRTGEAEAEVTLKCRSEDRYFAAGSDLRSGQGLEPNLKLEEDIAAPFLCRFSRSNTVCPPEASLPRPDGMRWILGEAARIFPVLGTLRYDERPCPADTPLRVVHQITAFERVFTGAKLALDAGSGDTKEATVALILWSNGKEGRPLVAEFSFRLKDQEERYTRELATSARRWFEAVQRLDWCRPGGVTKTEFVYRDRGGD